ncbi:MAG: hypothetical protein Q8M40_02810 [Legionella sp.]|nr:hypothetical protein [Legionella sp.]
MKRSFLLKHCKGTSTMGLFVPKRKEREEDDEEEQRLNKKTNKK